MLLKSVQWNIGGGKIRKKESDAQAPEVYNEDCLQYIIDSLKTVNPDIITLQETHADKNGSQAKEIADSLGYEYFFNDEYDNSHLTEGQRLSQSVISRFPIINHNFSLFFNPLYKVINDDGKQWVSHDKGISTCEIVLSEVKKIKVQTLHLIPFRKFNIDPLGVEAELVRNDVTKKIDKNESPFLLQGDFNYEDSLNDFLPEVFNTEINEIETTNPTTPRGRKYDRILYRGLSVKQHQIDNQALTDHYPLVTEFEVL